MNPTRAIETLLVLSAVVACSARSLPAEGQIRLSIGTDGILAPGLGDPPIDEPILFDRLVIEFLEPGEERACAGCRREFGVDARIVREGRASVGFLPRRGVSGYRARVQLFRSSGDEFVAPRPTSTLERIVRLPTVEGDGVIDVHVVLRTEDLGTATEVDAAAGPADGALVSTFARDRRTGCRTAPRDGEVCVPGAAYWMGDPSIDTRFERLVVVSPFFLDRQEITGAQLRASGFEFTALDPLRRSAANPHCTFEGDEDLALNCVSYDLAERYCRSRGARLPTEAEFELAATARRGARYPWGTTRPRCEDAVLERSDDPAAPAPSRACSALGTGPQRPGTGARDRVVFGGRPIVDLGGNVSEWVRDSGANADSPCLSDPVLFDPVCTTPPIELVIRGGDWSDIWEWARGASRRTVTRPDRSTRLPTVGFRCARDDR
jgi:formylglycine-generating enzyme required for sulfatase activity